MGNFVEVELRSKDTTSLEGESKTENREKVKVERKSSVTHAGALSLRF